MFGQRLLPLRKTWIGLVSGGIQSDASWTMACKHMILGLVISLLLALQSESPQTSRHALTWSPATIPPHTHRWCHWACSTFVLLTFSSSLHQPPHLSGEFPPLFVTDMHTEPKLLSVTSLTNRFCWILPLWLYIHLYRLVLIQHFLLGGVGW